jgi:hypothetical protein
MKIKKLLSGIAAGIILTAGFFSLTSCTKKDNSALAGSWVNNTGTKITFRPSTSQAFFEDKAGKKTLNYLIRKEYKFKVYVNRMIQFGMDMGNEYAGEELTFGTLYMNSDLSLRYTMSEGTFILSGGQGKTVEELDGKWSTTEATGLFAKMELDLSKATGEYTLTGYFDQDQMMGEDGVVLQMTGSYRTEPVMNLVFYEQASDSASEKGIEFQQVDNNLILLDGERFFKK